MKILACGLDHPAMAVLEQDCRTLLGDRLERFAAAGSCEAAAHLLDQRAFDVVLVDPAGLAGDWRAFVSGRGHSAQVIVVSERMDLAVDAFDCGALDFVPKPVVVERLARALARAASPQLIGVRRYGCIELVPVEDLVYVVGSDKYSEFVLANGHRRFCDKCLRAVEATLPASFVRIHKSYVVQFTMVSRLIVKRGSRYFAELKTGQRLPVGRSRYRRVKSRLLGESFTPRRCR